MFYHFDVDKWIIHVLPPVLRKNAIYSFLKVFLYPLKQLQESFLTYITGVNTRLRYNSVTASLERFLNGLFFFEYNAIYITDDYNKQVYLAYSSESQPPVYMAFQYETSADPVYLSSVEPVNVFGAFIVHVPAALSEADRATVYNWVNYYKFAGTDFSIEVYE